MSTVPFENFPFCGGNHIGLSPVTASARSINLYPERNTGINPKTPVALIGRAGLTAFATVGSGPIRAQLSTGAGLYVISGTHFYSVNVVLATSTDYGVIGASTGLGPCQIVTNGTQILLMDSSIEEIYYADTGAHTLTKVHDGYALEFLNGFFYVLDATNGIDPGTIYQSDFEDGTTWPALDFVDITTTSDHKCNLIVVNNQLWVMGYNNIEVWSNAGTAGFILAQTTVINQGMRARSPSAGAGVTFLGSYCCARAGNTVYWIGGSLERGSLQLYRADGFTPVRIPDAEALLSMYGNTADSYSFTSLEAGHTFFITNFPNATNYAGNNNGATLVYDLVAQEIHERSSISGGNPVQAIPSCFASCFNTSSGAIVDFAGSYNSGVVYVQSPGTAVDGSATIRYVRIAPHVTNSNRWTKHISLTLDMSYTVSNPAPQIKYSDDGGVSYNTIQDFQIQNDTTESGIRTWVSLQLGRSRDRVYWVQIQGGSPGGSSALRIANAWLSVEGGEQQ